MGAIKNKIAGKLKKAEGKLTGDKLREMHGSAQDKAGTVGMKARAGVAKAKAKIAKTKARIAGKAAKTKAGRKAAAAKAMP
jgi:uncharacterized protein YjbJ (UPF0337 family)